MHVTQLRDTLEGQEAVTKGLQEASEEQARTLARIQQQAVSEQEARGRAEEQARVLAVDL